MPAWKNITLDLPGHDLQDVTEKLGKMNRILSSTLLDRRSEKESDWIDDPEDPHPSISGDTHLLVLLVAAATNTGQLMNDVQSHLKLKKEPHHFEEIFEDRDWIKHSRSQFREILISDLLRIVPPWLPAVGFAGRTIIIEPGSGFGTGSHATTQLCLRWMETYLQNEQSLLDFGCGSGILGITADKMNASKTIGLDIDHQALDNAERNRGLNKSGTEFFHLDDYDSSDTFDIVIANILSNTLIGLKRTLFSRIKPGGVLLLSGILSDQAVEVISAYSPEITLTIQSNDGGWVLLFGRKDET